MKTKLLAGVALAVILGVSSAAYANPKNSFSDNNSQTVTSTAANIQIGNISAGNGTTTGTGGDNDSEGVGVGLHNGKTEQGDSTNVGVANSESFNISLDGVSNQTLVGASVLNIQANVAASSNSNSGSNSSASDDQKNEGENKDNDAFAVLVNGGSAASIGNNSSGVTTATSASGVGAQNTVGISVGASGIASF
jgi:hypothetical protein